MSVIKNWSCNLCRREASSSQPGWHELKWDGDYLVPPFGVDDCPIHLCPKCVDALRMALIKEDKP